MTKDYDIKPRSYDNGTMDESANRLDRFLIKARSLWSTAAVSADGLYAERMDFTGIPLITPRRRVMAQARQIYVFCDAALSPSERFGGETALRALEHTLLLYSDNGDLSQGLAFAIAPDGTIVDARRDAYAHAFALFALAAAYRLDRDRHHLRRAEALDRFIATQLTDPEHGGLWSSVPAPDQSKLQNPLMHLFEAYLFLHRAAPEGPYLEKAGSLARLFCERIFDQAGMLPERMNRDWSVTDPADRIFEPGHHFEWVWLLDAYDEASGTDHSRMREALWRTALQAGLDARRRCMDVIGFDLVPQKTSTRLWPHAEGLKAACSMARATPEQAKHLCQDMIAALLDIFLDKPFAGGWIDHFDADGALVDYVPATSLYHLHLANATLQSRRGALQ